MLTIVNFRFKKKNDFKKLDELRTANGFIDLLINAVMKQCSQEPLELVNGKYFIYQHTNFIIIGDTKTSLFET